MICKDGLVVASDSKATRGPTAREEFLKIWDLDVGHPFKAVITGAGRSAFIAKYRNLLEEVCAVRSQRQPIQTVPEFITVAEEAMQNMSRQYGTERLARLGVMRTGVGEEEHSSTNLFDILPNLVAVIGIHDDKPHRFSSHQTESPKNSNCLVRRDQVVRLQTTCFRKCAMQIFWLRKQHY